MTFDRGTRMDTGRVRTSSGAGGRVVMGGGAGVVVALLVALLLGGDPGTLLGTVSGNTESQGAAPSLDHCETGADANAYVDCRVLYTVGSLDAVWETQLPAQTGVAYEPPGVELFTSSVATACGNATSEVGPFYCPADRTAYVDTTFFDVLVSRFGANTGPLAQEYVVAHEFGHHIQNQLGDLGRGRADSRGATSASVRTELQADCYAGVWAHHADDTAGPDGTPFLLPLSTADVDDALSAAAAVGDDRIARSSGARVDPESWTHGSAEQRRDWFLEGYDTGRVEACDTFELLDPAGA
ncbi:hypothetical protein DW322_13590 [Rhodococcus rhodnii]|uniref:Metalloprotease n=2 Tax=Rhodococcus rhodnii TaxID=38312 RepID=R7WKR5_9NOCA|nr:neutral zinc metallopeptidase [Rhodococcus rhodnii]EOM75901.1 metalloprotease [Rhodococcus rhodnii LMG 5362]TXG91065.1 hypothetical protein DW322_13590 [Rhodococcus rhodnii]